MPRPHAAEVEHPNVRAVRVGHRERGSSCVRRTPGWHRVHDLEPSGDQCGLKPPVDHLGEVRAVWSEGGDRDVPLEAVRHRVTVEDDGFGANVVPRCARGSARRGRRWPHPGAVSEGSSVRVVVADDSMLTREGIVRLLREADIDVVDGAEDADEMVRHVRSSRGFSCPNLPTSTAGSSPCSPSCAHRRSHRHPPESTTAAARLRPRRSPRHTIRRGSRLRTVELRLDEVAGETPMLTPPTPGSAGCPTVGGPGRSPCDRRRRPSRRCS